MRPDHLARNLSLLRWTRNILFVIGIISLGYYGYATADARIYQAIQTRRFEQVASQTKVETPMRQPAVALPGALSSPDDARSLTSPGEKSGVIGRLEIEKIGLAVMILEGTDNQALRRGVGHIPETALPGESGNVGIAGHRDTFFEACGKLKKMM